MPLSLSLCGLPRGSAADVLRAQLDTAAQLAVRWVTLDGTLPGARARELDRSGRRDLASLLRRRELSCAGVDLWIPGSHFTSATEQDRALSAVLGAIELAADLSRLSASAVVSTARSALAAVVSVSLPADAAAGLVSQIEARGAACNVRIADHARPAGVPASAGSMIGAGMDPASVLLAGEDPVGSLLRQPGGPAVARLTDASTIGRVEVGSREGRLDVVAYQAALAVLEYDRPVVIDVRGLADAASAARGAMKAWGAAS